MLKLICCALVSLLLSTSLVAQQWLNVHTGGVSGVYYPLGRSICDLQNAANDAAYYCSASPSDGSIANLEFLDSNQPGFAIAQSDLLPLAWRGEKPFARPMTNLRSIMTLHREYYFVVAAKNSGIFAFEDLKGKRVNLGSQKSGHRYTSLQLLKHLGWDIDDFSQASSLEAHQQVNAICKGRIDAMVYTVGKTSRAIDKALVDCGAYVVGFAPDFLESFIISHPWYTAVRFAPKTLPQQANVIHTFALDAILLSNQATPGDFVAQLKQRILANLAQLKHEHPALEGVQGDEGQFEVIIPKHAGL